MKLNLNFLSQQNTKNKSGLKTIDNKGFKSLINNNYLINNAINDNVLIQNSNLTNPIKSTTNILFGKRDLASVSDFIKLHLDSLERKQDIKGLFTKDSETIKIAKKVFEYHEKKSCFTDENFFKTKIFEQPALDKKQCGSFTILISEIEEFPEYHKTFEEKKLRNSLICVGGPAAEDQVVMSSLIEEIRTKIDDITYITKDYKESNVNHSAKQSHARHGNALNADECLSGHKLLPVLLKRMINGVRINDVLNPDYVKIDVKFTLNPKKLAIYLGNEINWLRQEIRKKKKLLTEHDINRIESVLSQEILIAIEDKSKMKISGGLKSSQKDSSSIHINFSQEGEEHIKKESDDLAKVNIVSQKLSEDKTKFFFGENPYIHSAYEYKGDSHILFNVHQINKKIATQNGAKWIDGKQIERIFVRKNKNNNAEVVGVLTKEQDFFYCNNLHITGGYKVNYKFDKKSKLRFNSNFIRNCLNKIEDVLNVAQPLSGNITTATGVSINSVFKKSERLNRIIEKYGTTGEIAVTNSHWTVIAQDEEHIVMRMTGGGNTGSEEYNPSYFLNVLANTRRIFGDDLIGIISTYGCPRAVNSKNSTEFDVIAKGGLVSYGKGGTGNTKRHAEAAFALIEIGFQEEIKSYYNQFNTRHQKPLGNEICEAYQIAKEINFFHNNIQKTNRRMGYDSSLSKNEKLVIIGLAIVILVLIFLF